MKISSGCVVTLRYDVSTETGEIIETSDISGPVSFVHGKGSIIPGLDRRLEGMEAGGEGSFEFPPEEAFGEVGQGPEKSIARAEFPQGAELGVGASFEAGTAGQGQPVKLTVAEVTETHVVVRLAHPLAGQKINMNVAILGVREPTRQERESGEVVTRPPPPPPRA